jgi:rhodanese-related sulfurtransferase
MCTAWQRAAKAACEMGYTNIRHFSEGIKGWEKSNKS